MPSAPRSRARAAVGRAFILACVSLACSRSKTLPSADSAPSAIASAPAPAPRTRPDVALFFLSSLRGHVESDGTGPKSGGLARAATLIDRGRIDARGVVIVDAGDFLPSRDDGGDAGAALDQRVKLVAASYKRMGVDIVTPGEREIALGLDRLRAVLRTGRLRAVAANLVTKRGEPAFDDEPIVEAAGVPVGVFGIVELAPDSAEELERAGLATTDGVEAARAAVRALRDKGATARRANRSSSDERASYTRGRTGRASGGSTCARPTPGLHASKTQRSRSTDPFPRIPASASFRKSKSPKFASPKRRLRPRNGARKAKRSRTISKCGTTGAKPHAFTATRPPWRSGKPPTMPTPWPR